MNQAKWLGWKMGEGAYPWNHASMGLAPKETKETWQLNATYHPGLDPGHEWGHWGNSNKVCRWCNKIVSMLIFWFWSMCCGYVRYTGIFFVLFLQHH